MTTRSMRISFILFSSMSIAIIFLITTTIFISSKDTVAEKVTPKQPGWHLVWNDEFNGPGGSLPDSSKWIPEIGGDGWGNHQLEYDTKNQNAFLDGQGRLIIEARQNASSQYQCWYGTCKYTSAHISTSTKFSFTYGSVQARIKLPSGQGVWPAFWLLGVNNTTVGWPDCGEIDIMENVGKEPATIHGTIHGPGYSDQGLGDSYTLPTGKVSGDYHIYAVEWTPNSIRFFIDGINYFTVNKTAVETHGAWVFDHPFYIILNDAIGGVWPGSPDASTVFPQQMSIDYVRVSQLVF